MRSLATPLMHALISSPNHSLGCGIFNLFFRDRKVHKRPTVRRAAAASCLHAHRELLCRARSADGTSATWFDVRCKVRLRGTSRLHSDPKPTFGPRPSAFT